MNLEDRLLQDRSPAEGITSWIAEANVDSFFDIGPATGRFPTYLGPNAVLIKPRVRVPAAMPAR